MNERKTMIAISYKYPFEPPAEVFLHNELVFTKEKAAKVIIITTAGNIDKNVNYIIDEKIKTIIVSDTKNSFSIICSCIIELCKSTRYVLNDIIASKWNFLSAKSIFTSYIWSAYKLSKTIPKFHDIELFDTDEILIYSYWFGNYAIYACMLKKWISKHNKTCSVRVISRAHGQGDLYTSQNVKTRPGKNYIANNIDSIFPISELGKEILRKEYPNVYISTQRLGVSGPDEDKASCERKTYIIVSCSTVNENKRVDYIARSILSIYSLNIKWVHFGAGKDFTKLKNLVDVSKPNNVEVDLKGNSKNSDILSFYANDCPDLFINFSLVEGIPVSIMEAMAYSIPVIATSVGAVSEIVANNKNGFLVDANENNANVASIIEEYFHKSIEERNVYRECAFFTWKQNFSSTCNYIDFANKIWRY